MSSNLQIPRTCIYCRKDFIAKTIITRYCSHTCNRRHYKQIKQQQKIASTSKIIQPIKDVGLIAGQKVSIPEAARLLGVTDRTIFRLIAKKIIKPVRSGRKVRMFTSEILKIKVYDNLY